MALENSLLACCCHGVTCVSAFYLSSPATARENTFDGVLLTRELLLLYSPATAPENSLMSTHFYPCRKLLGLQVQRFVEQQHVSLKWITQGLSNSGRKWSTVFPLKQPCNQDTRSLLCPQHT